MLVYFLSLPQLTLHHNMYFNKALPKDHTEKYSIVSMKRIVKTLIRTNRSTVLLYSCDCFVVSTILIYAFVTCSHLFVYRP